MISRKVSSTSSRMIFKYLCCWNMDADSLDVLLGPLEVGATVTSFLFGCLAIQTYVYYSRFSADSLIVKIFVASVVMVGFAHLLCVGVALWQMSIGVHGNPALLSVFPFAADMIIAFTVAVSFCVQLFFTLRLLRLSGGRVLPSMCLAMSTLFAVSGFVVTAGAFATTTGAQFVGAQFVTITLSLTTGAVCDLMITAGLIYNLIKMRASSFAQTSRLIDALILWTIETGLAPCICALVVIACFALMRENYIWIGVYLILAGIYANALLAVMNSRSFIQGRDMDGRVEMRPRMHQEHQPSDRPSGMSGPGDTDSQV
ncbi:hypothetical protein BV22DRAFT_470365 [Leucogyrophana mollusca]|uniref:Uncharacterized protein n=1 Tax=Leucogyrophana mollusca TaxID=85980 RepID=A0ACB8BHI0_9AGAM|nr:hypothetical protein BV22DRAFT_470365 [Leucogyrophana mollusca]